MPRTNSPGSEISDSEIRIRDGEFVGRDKITTTIHVASPASETKRSLPKLTPYLTDRKIQEVRLTKRLQTRLDSGIRRPLIALVFGSQDQCPGEFVLQLAQVTLPDLLEQNDMDRSVTHRHLQWRGTFDELEDDILQEFKLGGAPLRKLAQRIRGNSHLVHLGFSVSEWDENAIDAITRWPGWWRKLELDDVAAPSLVVITISQSERFFERLWQASKVRALRTNLRKIEQTAPCAEDLHLLPDLGSITYKDVEHWISKYVSVADPGSLRLLLRPAFSHWLFGPRLRSMEDTAQLIRNALKHPSVVLVDI